MDKPIILLGAGGHASVVADQLEQLKRRIVAIVAPVVKWKNSIKNFTVIEDDSGVMNYSTNSVEVVNGIGSLPRGELREKIFRLYLSRGYSFASVISPTAVVSQYATIGQGVQVMPGAIVQAGVVIGDNTIINTGAVIDHDCTIGSNCHISPGATVCGGVVIGDSVHVGAGSVIIQEVTIAERAVVGAGAVASKDIDAGVVLFPPRSVVGNKNG